jgi:putative ABC transport system permease protein
MFNVQCSMFAFLLMNDLRYAFRQLLKNPGFTAVAVLTLALGIGATTAIVSVVKTAVFDPLPVRHAERFVQLGVVDQEGRWWPAVNRHALSDVRQQANLFSRVAAYEEFDGLTLQGEEFPQPVEGVWVTPEFFALWNLRPLLGRTFTADEGRPGNDDVLVISHRLWQREFGGDPAIIGRAIRFRERLMTVVGVMPPHFAFPRARFEYWRPIHFPDPAADDSSNNTGVIAEMRTGVETAQVQAFLDVLTRRQAQQFNEGKISQSIHVRALGEMFSKPEVRRTLGLLLGAIAFVLFISAANMANLQLARTETRQQELALRAALGAGRARVFRQLLTESLLLAVLGGAAGLGFTAVGLDLLQKIIPPDLPRLKPIGLHAGVLGIASAVTVATGLLFGLAPAWRGRWSNLSEVLKLGAATSTRDRQRGRFSRTLIVGQVALVLVLLAGAGLMVRSVIVLLRLNPGYDPHFAVHVSAGVLRVGSDLAGPENTLAARFARFADAQRRIAAIPGVIASGYSFKGRGAMTVSTTPDGLFRRLDVEWTGVEEADSLRVLRVPLKRGRWLDRNDMGESVPSVMVNETAARQLWPDEEAVGKRLWQEKPYANDPANRDAYLEWLRERGLDASMIGRPYEVVGVVADTVDYSGREVVAARYTEGFQPIIYRALERVNGIEVAEPCLFVRTAVSPVTLYKPIARAINATGANVGMPWFFDLEDALRAGRAGHQTVMLYLGIFAGVGLLLAAVGLYGVLAYSVARRTREIGIRMALGAQIADVMGLVVRQGLVLVAAGGVIGIIVALATGRLLRAYLFGVSSSDPVTFIAVALVLAAVALFACWLPARRAARVDPMEALRYE